MMVVVSNWHTRLIVPCSQLTTRSLFSQRAAAKTFHKGWVLRADSPGLWRDVARTCFGCTDWIVQSIIRCIWTPTNDKIIICRKCWVNHLLVCSQTYSLRACTHWLLFHILLLPVSQSLTLRVHQCWESYSILYTCRTNMFVDFRVVENMVSKYIIQTFQ